MAAQAERASGTLEVGIGSIPKRVAIGRPIPIGLLTNWGVLTTERETCPPAGGV